MHSRTRNYVAGLGSGYIVTIATVLVGLWLTPFSLRFLDREEFAIFTLASDVLMWLGLLDLGITSGLSAQAAKLSGRPDQDRLNRLVSTGFFAQCAVALVVLLVGSVFAICFPYFFPVKTALQHKASLVMALLVGGSVLSLGTQTFGALLVASQKVHVDNMIRIVSIAVRTILTVILLKAGWGLFSLAVANLVQTLISSTIGVACTFRLLSGLQIRLRLASWEIFRGISRLGIWFSLGGLAGIVISSLDRVVAAKLISVETVTTLSLTGRLYALSDSFLQQVTNTARPMLGQMLGQNKSAETLQVYRQIFALSSGLAVVAAMSMWAGNGCFVSRWVGPQNYGGIWLDLALAMNLIVHKWVLPNRAILTAGLLVKPQVLVRLIEGGLNISLSLLLAKSFGVVGIVISTAIAGILTSCWYLPLLTARMFDRSFMEFVKSDVFRILLLMLCLLPISYVSRELAMNLEGYVGAFVGASLSFIAGISILWLLVFDDPIRIRIRQALSRFVGVAQGASA